MLLHFMAFHKLLLKVIIEKNSEQSEKKLVIGQEKEQCPGFYTALDDNK